jgi:ABC-type transporter Mla MlaB component
MTEEPRPIVLCDVTGAAADVVLVGALARMALTARRAGCQLRLHGASQELRALVELMGLAELLFE